VEPADAACNGEIASVICEFNGRPLVAAGPANCRATGDTPPQFYGLLRSRSLEETAVNNLPGREASGTDLFSLFAKFGSRVAALRENISKYSDRAAYDGRHPKFNADLTSILHGKKYGNRPAAEVSGEITACALDFLKAVVVPEHADVVCAEMSSITHGAFGDGGNSYVLCALIKYILPASAS
jgi:hypothetical protein